MPQLDPQIENLGAPCRSNYYILSKQEKKRIKKELREFAKGKQGLTKENELRQNLIKTEEALEAKINEGSQASSLLDAHRKNVKKVISLAKPLPKESTQSEKVGTKVEETAQQTLTIEKQQPLLESAEAVTASTEGSNLT